MEGNPLMLTYTLQELLGHDTVQVELIPEKKGLFLKHVEYEVSSQFFKSSVYRRYNDFVMFQEMLLQKYPYRMVPALPPKRMLGVDREFIESRRRGLKRFVNLVARHPSFWDDILVNIFLSYNGQDVQNKMRESSHAVGDEYMLCKLATQAKDFLPADIQVQFAASRELIRNIFNSFYKLRDRAERMAGRAIDNATDLLGFGRELSALGSDTTPLPSWATPTHSSWGALKQALKGLSVEFSLLADKAAQQEYIMSLEILEKCLKNALQFKGLVKLSTIIRAVESQSEQLTEQHTEEQEVRNSDKEKHLEGKWKEKGKLEEIDVVEKLNLFLDLLQSYKDLCERHEKGVLHKHQKALHKYSLMKKQMMSATVQNKESESVEQLESRIVEVYNAVSPLIQYRASIATLGQEVCCWQDHQQENAIMVMELRNYFSLFCLHQETQLIHIYLPLTSHILGAFVNSQIQGHKEMTQVWNELKPKLNCLFVGSSGLATPPLSPEERHFFTH